MRILISAGPTREPIDPVRFLSNYSTGVMGICLATEALRRGHRVSVVSGPVEEKFPKGARVMRVEQSDEMEQALRHLSKRADAVIMAAAVVDFRLANPVKTKLGRHGAITLRFKSTPDIVARLPRRPSQVVAGFALESGHVVQGAKHKLREKKLDLLLAQALPRIAGRGRAALAGPHAPFGRERVRAWLLSRDGIILSLGLRSKAQISRVLLDKIEALWYGQISPLARLSGRANGAPRSAT